MSVSGRFRNVLERHWVTALALSQGKEALHCGLEPSQELWLKIVSVPRNMQLTKWEK